MSDREINVALTEEDLLLLRQALYGNMDNSWTPTLQHAEGLHAKFSTASEALRLRRNAAKLEAALAVDE